MNGMFSVIVIGGLNRNFCVLNFVMCVGFVSFCARYFATNSFVIV